MCVVPSCNALTFNCTGGYSAKGPWDTAEKDEHAAAPAGGEQGTQEEEREIEEGDVQSSEDDDDALADGGGAAAAAAVGGGGGGGDAGGPAAQQPCAASCRSHSATPPSTWCEGDQSWTLVNPANGPWAWCGLQARPWRMYTCG